jgi:hypothetical protein
MSHPEFKLRIVKARDLKKRDLLQIEEDGVAEIVQIEYRDGQVFATTRDGDIESFFEDTMVNVYDV